MNEIAIIPTTADHIDAIYEIELESFTAPWPKDAFPELMESPTTHFITAINEKSKIVGFAAMYIVSDEAQILNIAVTPAARNQGAGAKLLSSMIKTAAEENVSEIYLEVRASNAKAQSLYKSHGFTALAVRKNYYQSPAEDAILMRRKDSQT